MTDNGGRGVEAPSAQAGTAVVGYQTAVSLWIYEGGLIWAKFNAMLVANSLVLAAIGFTVGAKERVSTGFSLSLTVGGLVLCFSWLVAMKRGFDAHRYWILSARELEECGLAPVVVTVSRGGAVFGGARVSLKIGGQDSIFGFSRIGRIFNAARAAYLAIMVFVTLYLIFGAATVL